MSFTPNTLVQKNIYQASQYFQLNRHYLGLSGTLGQHTGKKTGTSVEFQEFRPYQAGDDIRHIDWAGYARNKQLNLRIYREEISPHIDIIVDNSTSMAINDGRKEALTRELSGFFLLSNHTDQGNTRLLLTGNHVHPQAQLTDLHFKDKDNIFFHSPHYCLPYIRHQGLCIIISDFLTTHNMLAGLRQIAARATQVVIIMLLGPWEAQPQTGNYTLHDAETSQQRPLLLDSLQCQQYLQRLHNIQQQIKNITLQTGNLFIPVIADQDLLHILKQDFYPTNIITHTL